MPLITRLDGTQFDLKPIGIWAKDFIVSAPNYRHVTAQVAGANGLVVQETTFGERTITMPVRIRPVDFPDYALMRDMLFSILRSDEEFFISDDREPGKQWLVRCTSFSDLQQLGPYGDTSIVFTCYRGFAESVGDTLNDPITMDSDKWQMVGGGLPMDRDLNFSPTTNQFSIYNGGDIAIDPTDSSQPDFIITFKGTSSGLTIMNETTGDQFIYNGTTSSSDILTLKNVQVLKNGVSDYGNSNGQAITLAPGYNNFTISGTSGSFEIDFQLKFLYL